MACFVAAGTAAAAATALVFTRHSFAALELVGIGAGALALYAVYQVREELLELQDEAKKAERRSELYEREIRRHREVVDALADGLEVGIFLCDPKMIVEYSNKKAIELFRYDVPKGRNILAVTLSHELETLVGDAVRTSEPTFGEVVLRYPDERVCLAKAWVDPMAGERVFLTLQEITHLRRLERIRRDFVANVSHELRTPMTTIRAMAETLTETDEEDMKHLGPKYLNRIIAEVDRLNLITEDLLTLSSAESKSVEKRPTDLSAIVREAVSDLADKAAQKQIEFVVTVPREVLIEANPHQLSQVLVNLFDNAINYSNEGSVEVSLDEANDGYVQLRVQDHGIGIPAEHHPRIFERFYRVDKGRSRATGGTGLGLSIVKHIVESHGGSVSLVSFPGEGSTFTIRLPKT